MAEPTFEPPLSNPRSKVGRAPVHQTLAGVANLANLLPTGTLFAFQALVPLFSGKGNCQLSNKYLTAGLVGICGIACFLSSFTDSFVDSEGKSCYGFVTFRGLRIFNDDGRDEGELAEFKIGCMDFVHALVSVLVFLIFALTSTDVHKCFFHHDAAGANATALLMNLPVGAGIFSTFLCTIFPTRRRGIGYV